MAKNTLEILRHEQCKIFNVRLTIFLYYAGKVESEIFSNKEFHIHYNEKLTSKLLVNSAASSFMQGERKSKIQ